MPLADFYSAVPVAGENPVEYWVRLNKTVDVAEEALTRLGRQMDNPCQEAAMMFDKHCPDPALSAIFRLKAPDKWTASEVQEHLDRYQTEQKEQLADKSKRNFAVRNAAAHLWRVRSQSAFFLLCHLITLTLPPHLIYRMMITA